MPEPYQWTSVLETLNELDGRQLVTRQAFEKTTRGREWEWAVAQRAQAATGEVPQGGSPWLTFADGAKVLVARQVLAAWVGEFSLAHVHANEVLRLSDSREHGARCLMWRLLFETLVAKPESWNGIAKILKDQRPLADADERIYELPF